MSMIDAAPAAPFHDPGADLGRRIGWICWVVRVAAAGYAVWTLAHLVAYWSDAAMVKRGFGYLSGKDLSGLQDWQRLVGFSVHFGIWLLTAAACYCAWRLFGEYLDGRVFGRDAAIWMTRIGVVGLAAQLGDILLRPLLIGLMTLHLPASERAIGVFANPPDLLNLLFLFALVGLGRIFKAAAEMAEDHAGIV
jgi:hypothetical protein